MVTYPTCSQNKRYEIKGEWYALVSHYLHKEGLPLIRSRSSAKAYITKEATWRESIGGDKPWNIEKFKRLKNAFNDIYKLVDGEWVLIFETDSPAFYAWCTGQLTTKELRDTIPW